MGLAFHIPIHWNTGLSSRARNPQAKLTWSSWCTRGECCWRQRTFPFNLLPDRGISRGKLTFLCMIAFPFSHFGDWWWPGWGNWKVEMQGKIVVKVTLSACLSKRSNNAENYCFNRLTGLATRRRWTDDADVLSFSKPPSLNRRCRCTSFVTSGTM